MQFTRRSFCTFVGLASLTLVGQGLIGCKEDAQEKLQGSTDTGAPFTAQAEDRELKGSDEVCDVRVGLIMGPPSMGLSQFIIASQNGDTYNNFEFTPNGVDYVGLSAAFNQGDYDICTLPSNIGPILYNNHELKNEYCIVSINNLGILYVMSNSDIVHSFGDLAGKTVYSYGEGGTPEYTIEALLKKNGMEGEVTVEFKSAPLEILNIMQEVEDTIAILPQPFVSLSKILVDPLYIPVDLTEEWDEAFSDTGSQMVTTTTIVNKQFLEEHEQAVIEYLKMAEQSINWTYENFDKAAALQEKLGTFLNNDVALDAFPYIKMVNLTGVEMRDTIAGFFEELYKANPDSIGGALPDDAFYYIPPVGYLD